MRGKRQKADDLSAGKTRITADRARVCFSQPPIGQSTAALWCRRVLP
jgi:hypothetical protein